MIFATEQILALFMLRARDAGYPLHIYWVFL